MERTTTVNSPEEMCDMMCNNQLPEEKEQWWVFTFGCRQENAGYHVRIWGTFFSARDKMFDKYGDKWGFQYSWEEWKEMFNDPGRQWEMERELEVIE